MISHTSSISSSIGNLIKEKDYDLIHYFDEQSDNEIEREKYKKNHKKIPIFQEKDTNNMDNNFPSSDESDELSKEDSFFIDDESIYESNEKIIEISPDGNFGKVNHNYYIIINFF